MPTVTGTGCRNHTRPAIVYLYFTIVLLAVIALHIRFGAQSHTYLLGKGRRGSLLERVQDYTCEIATNVTTHNRSGLSMEGCHDRLPKEVAAAPAKKPSTELPVNCKIYILDLSSIAEAEGIPKCKISDYATDPLTQRVLPDPTAADPSDTGLSNPPDSMRHLYPYATQPHNYSQHAGPWFLKKSIQNSALVTTNITAATVILVDDYCYLISAMADLRAKGHWWLDVHGHYKSNYKAGQHLLDLYHAMAHQKEFMHKQARNFLFVTPLTSFDFGDSSLMERYTRISCEHFSNSMHIVSDQVQRWQCSRYRPDRVLVAPLSIADSTDQTAPPHDVERNLTLLFRGNCEPQDENIPQFAGLRLRRQLVKLFSGTGEDISVTCTESTRMDHESYMREMSRSKFCIVLPGETQNTPRITEAFLAGCVPVFLGAPWHAMPYSDFVDYTTAAVLINILDISSWAKFGAKWVLEENTPKDQTRLHPKWWTPQVSAKDMHELESLTGLSKFLQSYDEQLYQKKKAAVAKYRELFNWASQQSAMPSASGVALQQMCRWGQQESKIVHANI